MKTPLLVACLMSVFAWQATAEPVTIAAAAKGSNTYSMALAVVTVAAKAGMDLRPQPFKSTSQGLGFVNSDEIDFGLENSIALRQAAAGQGKFAGAALADLRLVARLQPLRMAVGVRADSGITSIADLRGKRLPSEFSTAVTGEMVVSALLAGGGLTYDDVEKVPVGDFQAMVEAFAAGKIDAIIHVIGTPRDEQVAQDVGGLLALPMSTGDDTAQRLAKVFPEGSVVMLDPEAGISTITRPTAVLQYDFYVYTSAAASDADVTTMVQALHTGKDDMAAALASLRWFDADRMYADIGVPYHPAAEAFYRANGMMP